MKEIIAIIFIVTFYFILGFGYSGISSVTKRNKDISKIIFIFLWPVFLAFEAFDQDYN